MVLLTQPTEIIKSTYLVINELASTSGDGQCLMGRGSVSMGIDHWRH